MGAVPLPPQANRNITLNRLMLSIILILTISYDSIAEAKDPSNKFKWSNPILKGQFVEMLVSVVL